MKNIKVNELLKFIRDNDVSGLYKSLSNNKLRKYVWDCKHKKSFYLVFNDSHIIGIIEWYRLLDFKTLLQTSRNKKQLFNTKGGKLLWIQNAIFIKGKLTIKVYRQFLKIHKGIENVFWWRYKNKQIFGHKMRGRQ